MELHAAKLGFPLAQLQKCFQDAGISAPSGGDYMRMWTKVLVEDNPVDDDGRPYYVPPVYDRDSNPELRDSAQHFDAFYFVGPSDVHEFFMEGEALTMTAALETHFARKYATDPDFRDAFAKNGIAWGSSYRNAPNAAMQERLRLDWEAPRRDYIRFYSLRASVNFSLGSHDEWEIFRQINIRRRKALEVPNGDDLGVPEQLAGFFDQSQIDPGASEAALSRGYACIDDKSIGGKNK